MPTKTKFLSVLIFIFFISMFPLYAQRAEEGMRYFNNHQYQEAKNIYAELLKKTPKDKLTNYRYARCCFELGEVDTAIKYFEIAGAGYLETGYYLGQLYIHNYDFDKAIDSYEKYLSTQKGWDEKTLISGEKIGQATLAEKLLSRVEDIAIIDSIVVDKDKFLSFYKISKELGELKQEKIQVDSLHYEDKISYITQRKDRVYFSDISNGNMDLFTSYKLLDGWSNPVSLSNIINTTANENYPFLLLDGVTVYYASDGEGSIGGYDIFITKYVSHSNTYLAPENIGMPFNSPFNDYMMVIDEVNGVGWFATDRYLPDDKVAVHTFIPNETKNILRIEDVDAVKQYAQLKRFRRGEKPVSSPGTNSKSPAVQQEQAEWQFLITGDIIYTKESDFRSSTALEKWEELNRMISERNNREEQLEQLRRQYQEATEDNRKLIAPKIIVLENQLHDEDDNIENLKIAIRNIEIEYLIQDNN